MEKWILLGLPMLLGLAVASKFGVVKIAQEMVAAALEMAEGYNEQYRVDDVDGTTKDD